MLETAALSVSPGRTDSVAQSGSKCMACWWKFAARASKNVFQDLRAKGDPPHGGNPCLVVVVVGKLRHKR